MIKTTSYSLFFHYLTFYRAKMQCSFVCTLIPLNSLLLVFLCFSESSSQVHFALVQSKLSQILLKIRHKMIVFFH